jgi:hypothetical protein
MVHRYSGDCGQHCQIYAFAQMHVHMFPYATHGSGRQSAVRMRCRRQLQKCIDRVQARASMQIDVCWIARGANNLLRWSHKRGEAVVAAGEQQSLAYIGPVPAPKKVEVSFENRPQADTRLQPAIIEHEGPARNTVCTDDALIAVNREQHA